MSDGLPWHRIQFAFSITYHYLFPQLTMGLALLILVIKFLALRTGEESYNEVARFWARIFALNFAMGVVTGIPLEFQFGTNWARFSNFAGEIVGHTLAMEGIFAFFLESSFLGLFLYGEKRMSPQRHFATAFALFLGSWLSGYFIIVTNAFMQHPVGYSLGEDGRLHLANLMEYLLNPWALWQYAHNMMASVVTASFVVAAVGAYWSLLGANARHAWICLKVGIIAGAISILLVAFPTGDQQGKMLSEKQPVTLAAMEGLFEGGPYAELAIIGQPNVAELKLENPIVVPGVLSFLAYGTFGSKVKGLNDYPQDQWPDNVELLYYSYHIMVGLGTLLTLVMGVASFLLWQGRLLQTRAMLWVLMLSFPFPYIATTAGWWTAELGRQPWIIHGLMRTADAGSLKVNPGDVVFTLLGFAGLYLLLGLLFVINVLKEINRGPVALK
ncbi:cytochrome ubiquinol oxidase subunit I [Schlesneria paludicola]|uniref:cytochrome ubiquinol oxidase subunit I n=1 Tax=Schlesneria paludicola TaxID=360056 RepID=UPI00029AA2D3|nr:cytochrome ubiquinol oxidase subunit I [Schlesneria paludicola]